MFLVFAQSAHALSCIWGMIDANFQDGDVLPSNAELVFAHTGLLEEDLETLALEGPEGRVPFTLELGETWARITPLEALPPGDYSLEGNELGRAFSVADLVDEQAPTAPEIVEAKKKKDISEWGTTKGIDVEVYPTDDSTFFEYQVTTTGDFDGAHTTFGDTRHFIGQGLCLTSWQDYKAGDRHQIRVRAIDAAGNTSEWSESGVQRSILGCSSAPGIGGSMMLAMLGILGVRRR